MKIIDVSEYQGNIDWEKVSKNVSLVIARASVGKRQDYKYALNANTMSVYGIPYHAYHYLKALTIDDAEIEGDTFATAVKESDPLFLVVDCEYEKTNRGLARDIVKVFLQTVKKKIPDARFALYIGQEYYTRWNLDMADFEYIWIPRYGSDSGVPERKPIPYCDLWQYTSRGKVDGIESYVDVSVLNGDKPLSFFLTSNHKQTMLGRRTLRSGCVGEDVSELQAGLQKIGYYMPSGIYDAATISAVRRFQEDNGLVVDGVFGKKSLERYLESQE